MEIYRSKEEMMAEVQWIKFYTNTFDISRKIKKIELMPQGDTILIIWVKLLTLAGKVNDGGAIYITRSIPYEIEDLVEELRRPKAIVEKALSTLEMFDMVERVDGFIYISSWEEYQNAEGLDKIKEKNRLRQAKYKQKQKLLQGNVTDNVTDNVTITQGNATDIDIEEDKEKEKNKDIKKYDNIPSSPKPEPTPKHQYGEYKHVKLKDDEKDKLIAEYGEDTFNKAVTYLDEYIEMKGYKAKSHYLAIRKWVLDALKEREKPQKPRQGTFDVNESFEAALKRTYGG